MSKRELIDLLETLETGDDTPIIACVIDTWPVKGALICGEEEEKVIMLW